MILPPCRGNCERRSAVPNCHNEETCPAWGEYERKVREQRERRRQTGAAYQDYRAARRKKQKTFNSEWERLKKGKPRWQDTD